jgi:sialic acid synthase SpsE
MENDVTDQHPSTISIGNRAVGPGHPAYIVAEVGSNHDGSLATAKKLTRLCADAGVDAVKFQAYTRETLFIDRLPDDGTPESEHKAELLERRWNVLPETTVPHDWWPELKALCDDLGVDFLCTPFDLDRLERLVEVGMPAVKIASGDVTWLELLRAAGGTSRPVIFSTGASTLEESRRALKAVRDGGGQDVVALHCVSTYPAEWEDANLRAMITLGEELGVPVGLSDHTPGSTLPIAAVTLGACVIEKHVTLDRSNEGLDHHFALEVGEFAKLVDDVRHTEAALGSGRKTWVEDEETERYWVRRGLWCRTPIEEGETITREKLRVVRPNHGAGADCLEEVLGETAVHDLEVGDPLELNSIT